MIRTVLFDIALYTLGYFALFTGNIHAGNALVFIMWLVALAGMFVVVIVRLIVWAYNNTEYLGIDANQKLEMKQIILKMNIGRVNGFRKWYGLISSAFEVAILATFGLTATAIVWGLAHLCIYWCRDVVSGFKESNS